jgi:protein-tyrosine phosphatase
LAARPRGGEWLEDEIAAWRREGVDIVLSLLTSDEERDLDLAAEETAARSHGVRFFRFPIEDRQTPDSELELSRSLEKLDAELSAGRNVVVHCRQGIGRTGLFSACLLVGKGVNPEDAVQRLSAARGAPIPETPAQRRWIDRYATAMAVPHHE